MYFFWYVNENHVKDDNTKTFIKLGNVPWCLGYQDIAELQSLVKSVYYEYMESLQDKTLNELRKEQFIQSTSNDIPKLVPSTDAVFRMSWVPSQLGDVSWKRYVRSKVVELSFNIYFLVHCTKNEVFHYGFNEEIRNGKLHFLCRGASKCKAANLANISVLRWEFLACRHATVTGNTNEYDPGQYIWVRFLLNIFCLT